MMNETIEGNEIKVTIPAGIQTGNKLKIQGKGIPYLKENTKRGDQYIILTVRTPTNLNNKQKELLKQFEELENAVE